jgi:hypothetical protein
MELLNSPPPSPPPPPLVRQNGSLDLLKNQTKPKINYKKLILILFILLIVLSLSFGSYIYYYYYIDNIETEFGIMTRTEIKKKFGRYVI